MGRGVLFSHPGKGSALLYLALVWIPNQNIQIVLLEAGDVIVVLVPWMKDKRILLIPPTRYLN